MVFRVFRSILALVFVLGLVLTVTPAALAASPIYVRPGGDDANCDGTANVDYTSGLTACAVQTIQKGIDLVDVGGTVNVGAGTYNENISINKQLSIIGAGSSASGTIIAQNAGGAGDTKIGVIQIAASGVSGTPLLLKDLRIEPDGLAGISVGRFTEATGTSVSYLEFNNVHVIGNNTNPSTEQERGFYVDLTSTVEHLDVIDCAFDNLTYGWYFQKQVSADTSTVRHVEVSNTTFNHNNLKGIYAEKLSDASFARCVFSENGFSADGIPSYFLPWMSGLDLNLKAGAYANLSFVNCTIEDNGLGGAKEGVGLTVKGRGTGSDSSYATYPATVDDVSFTGCVVRGNERGLRFGEPGKSNTTPTNVVVSNSIIASNVQTYSGSDGSTYGGLVDARGAADTILAESNWWGAADGPASAGSGDAVSGNVDYDPFLTSPPDVYVDIVNGNDIFGTGSSTNPYATITKGVTEAFAGATVHVADGTYVEQVVIDGKDLTLQGASLSTIIQAPDTVPTCFTTSLDKKPIVCVKNATATVDKFTIDGAGKGNANYQFVGVAFRNAAGTLKNSAIKDIRDTPFSGAQHGVAIYAYNDDGTGRTINVWDNTVTGFQKNAMALNAGDTTPLTVDVRRNTVTGAGATTVTAQNGIQVSADLGTGVVADNKVSGIAYDNTAASTKWVATSILNYYADLNITGNTITGAHMGVYNIDGAGDITGNDLTIEKIGVYAYGILATDPPDAVPSPYGAEDQAQAAEAGALTPAAAAATLDLDVSNNEVVFSGSDKTDTYGIEADAGYGLNDIAIQVNNNIVSGFDYGVVFYQGTDSTGVFTAASATGNGLHGNTYAVYSNITSFTLNASGNWLGSNNPTTVASLVDGDVDYTPWLDSGTDTDGATAGFQGDFSTLWVDDDSPQTGTVGRIQEGIDLVSGSTLNVAAGVYDERIEIDKSLIMQGATHGVSKKGYVIPSGYAYDSNTESIIRPSVAQEKPVVNIKADDVVFDGFVVAYEVADSTVGGVYQDLVEVASSVAVNTGIQVINNVLGPNTNTAAQDGTDGRSGFTVVGPRTLPLKNLQVKNNKIFDAKGNGCGIMIVASYSPEYHGGSGTGYTDMSGSAIENNEITGNHRSGIELAGGVSGESAGGFLIKDNLITNNGWGGTGDAANLKYGHGVMMIRGGSDKAKTNPSGSRYLTFQDNTVTGNEKSGFYLGSQNHDITIVGNTIESNGGGGGGYNTWDGVRVDLDEAYYTGHTIRYDILANITIEESSILTNGDAGVKVIQTPTQGPVNAESNWWGSACGPGPVGPGSGDEVTVNVDYSPWWTDASGGGTASEGSGGGLVIPAGASTATQNAVIACAAGKTVTYAGDPLAGGVVVNTNGVTINLNGATVGPGSPAFTINADDVTILGPGVLDGTGSSDPGILVNGGADNFILDGVEVKDWADGVQLAGSVDSFKLVNNWLHSNTDAGLQVDSGVSIGGIVTIEGNLFKVNGGNGVQNNSGAALDATYNSWGDDGGPTVGNGDGVSADVTYDPWTYAEVYIDVDSGTTGDQYQRGVAESTSFDVALNIDGENLYGLSFEFTYDPAYLTFNGPPAFEAPWAGNCFVVGTPPAGTLAYQCYLTSGSAWDGGTVAKFNFTADGSALTGAGPWTTYFDVSHLAADTSAGAVGGVKVFVNNAGYNAASTTDRGITDTNDGEIAITGIAKYKGYVDLQGRANDSGAVVSVYGQPATSGATLLASGGSASSGSYTTEYISPYLLTIGTTYYFQVDGYLYLPTTVKIPLATDWAHFKLLSERPATTLGTVVLLGGDATNDDEISINDASCVGGDYGLTPDGCGTDGWSDVNGDGKVDILDLTLVGGNFYLTASPWTP